MWRVSLTAAAAVAQALEEPGLALHDHGGLFGIFGAQVSVVDSDGELPPGTASIAGPRSLTAASM